MSELEAATALLYRPGRQARTRWGGSPTLARFSLGDGLELVLVIDTLVAGVHFSPRQAAGDVGFKTVMVNASDLAAMGAHPMGATLGLTVPDVDRDWLIAFGRGLWEALDEHGIVLLSARVGIGPLTVSMELYGSLPKGCALRRDGARPGDLVCVTGTLGDAGLALAESQGELRLDLESAAYCAARLHRPRARVETGIALRGRASAAIDISDGLASDLGHLLAASGAGATIDLDRIPLSDTLRGNAPAEFLWPLALAAGDDYELCFALDPARYGEVLAGARRECAITWIGVVDTEPGLRFVDAAGHRFQPPAGYAHFTDSPAAP